MRSNSLLGRNMIYECPRNPQSAIFFRPTASTPTPLFDGAKVLTVARVFEIEHAAGGDGVAEALFVNIYQPRAAHARSGELTAVLVGQTQSNISAPKATATTISSG